MKKNSAFAIFLFIFVLMILLGVYVMSAGMDAYRNRTMIEDRPIGQNVISYVMPRAGDCVLTDA